MRGELCDHATIRLHGMHKDNFVFTTSTTQGNVELSNSEHRYRYLWCRCTVHVWGLRHVADRCCIWSCIAESHESNHKDECRDSTVAKITLLHPNRRRGQFQITVSRKLAFTMSTAALGMCDRNSPWWRNTSVRSRPVLCRIKGKGKVEPGTGHEEPERECKYTFTLSLTSVQDGGGVFNATPRSL